MQLISGVLAVAVFGLGSLSAHLHSELEVERKRANTEAQHCLDLHTQVGELEAADLLQATSSNPRQLGSAFPSSRVERAEAQKDADIGPETTADAYAGEFAPTARSGFDRRRHEDALRRLYGEVWRELDLSPELQDELVDLLLEQRAEQVETLGKFAGSRAQSGEAMSELKQQHDTQLMTLLGEKYLSFEDHQKNLGERMQIEQAALQLEAANAPLRDDQRSQLLNVMVDERERTPRPTWTVGIPADQNIAKVQRWQEGYEQRVRDRLTSILTSEQLKQYDVYRNLKATMRRRQQEAWHAQSSRDRARTQSTVGTIHDDHAGESGR